MIDELLGYTPSWTFGFHHLIYVQYEAKGWNSQVKYREVIQFPSQIHFVRDQGYMRNRYEGFITLAIL